MIYSKIEVMASNPQQQHQRVSAKENTWVRDEDLYGYDECADFPRAVLLIVTVRLGLS